MSNEGSLVRLVGFATLAYIGYQALRPRAAGYTRAEIQELERMCKFPIAGETEWFLEGSEPPQLKSHVSDELVAALDARIPMRATWSPTSLVDDTIKYLSPGCEWGEMRKLVAWGKRKKMDPWLLRFDAEMDVLDRLARERLEAAG